MQKLVSQFLIFTAQFFAAGLAVLGRIRAGGVSVFGNFLGGKPGEPAAGVAVGGRSTRRHFFIFRAPKGAERTWRGVSFSGFARVLCHWLSVIGKPSPGSFFDGHRRSGVPTMAVAAVAVFCAFALDAEAGRKHLESWYADALAAELGAKTEVRMRNGTRCDVLAAHHAVEVEFADKWAEAVGQALNYSSQTGRTGAVALVLESPADERFLARLREVISWHQLPIAVVVLRPVGPKSLELQGLDALAGRARK